MFMTPGSRATKRFPYTFSHQGFFNVGLSASVSSNILTVSLTDRNGYAPTASSPCVINFRSSTSGTGSLIVERNIIGTVSISTVVGASLGSSSNAAFRLWVCVFDNNGTPVLSLINCSTPLSAGAAFIYPINEGIVSSSTAMSAGATSAGVFYTPIGITVSSKALRILGYVEYNSTGLATAGTYTRVPDFIEVSSPGDSKPGDEIQFTINLAGTSQTTTTAIPQDNTIPQITEGREFMNATIVPTSAANMVEINTMFFGACSASDTITMAIFRNSDTNALSAASISNATNFMQSITLFYFQQTSTTSSLTYRVRAGPGIGTTTLTFNGQAGGALYGGVAGSYMIVKEVMG